MNYTNATVEEIVQHVLTVTAQSVSQMLSYHRDKGHTDIVNKILEARKIAKRIRLQRRLEELE